MERTADAIATVAGAFEAAWRSGRRLVGELPVPLPRSQGIHPRRAQVTEAYMKFCFGAPQGEGPRIEDVFSEMQVRVCGVLRLDGLVVELEDHWRIDTHVEQEGEPREAHPTFHFQRGGHAQEAFTGDDRFVPGPALGVKTEAWRGLMQYPGPRIAVAPMCPTTAIDFVLSQHDGLLWRRMMDNPDYLNLVNRCHDRLWELYAAGLADVERRRVLLGYRFRP